MTLNFASCYDSFCKMGKEQVKIVFIARNFPLLCSKSIEKKIPKYRIKVKKATTEPKTVHFKEVSTLPMKAIKRNAVLLNPGYKLVFRCSIDTKGQQLFSQEWNNKASLNSHNEKVIITSTHF